MTLTLTLTLTLDLPTELAKELAAAAKEAGMTLAEYSLHLLAMRSIPGVQLSSGADVVAYWRRLGLLGMRSDSRDSQEHARQLREKAEHRYRDG